MSPVLTFLLGLIAGIALVFVIVWLIVRVPDSLKQAEPTKPDPRPTLPPFPADSVPQGDHILVVDDEPELAESVANLLKENGYQVEITHSAEEAWKSLCKLLPTLIITDDVMPGAGGEELLKWLGDSLKTYEIPIIAQGNSFARPTMTTCWGKHFDMYLTKPFNPEELLSFVRRILQPRDDYSPIPFRI